jgi:hypothetical protein
VRRVLRWRDWSVRWKVLIPLLLLGGLALGGGLLGLSAVNRLRGELAAVQRDMTALDLVLQADRDAYQALSALYALLGTDPNHKARYEELARFWRRTSPRRWTGARRRRST